MTKKEVMKKAAIIIRAYKGNVITKGDALNQLKSLADIYKRTNKDVKINSVLASLESGMIDKETAYKYIRRINNDFLARERYIKMQAGEPELWQSLGSALGRKK